MALVRIGIGHENYSLPKDVDWTAVKVLADAQVLSAVVLDGLNAVSCEGLKAIPKKLRLEWIGEVLQNYEQRYKAYVKAIGILARWYNQHGFKMMVLKGFACSTDWPKSQRRPAGDIDIWLFGKQKEADNVLKKQGIVIDNSHHHHTVFEWKGFSVENHYDFVNVHTRSSSAELELIFKQLGLDDRYCTEVNGERVYLPSPNLHALFLIRHMVSHFAAANITLRQVLDWAFLVKRHSDEIDWKWLMGVLHQYHMSEFFDCINGICVDDLGFDSALFKCGIQYNPTLKVRILNDILSPAYTKNAPHSLFPRLLYKYRRWQGNAWKQRLCYSESRFTTFFIGLWAHLMKPASI